jgi:hypothetical protein
VDELGGDRVQVDDAVDAVVLLLQGNELADGAEIVAEMEIARRLDAGKDERLESGHDVLVRLVEGPSSGCCNWFTGALMHGGRTTIKRAMAGAIRARCGS